MFNNRYNDEYDNDKDYDDNRRVGGTDSRGYGNYSCPIQQRHVHEIQGSVDVAEYGEDAHCHRFSTVSGEAILCGGNDHYHEVFFNTDYVDGHYHNFCGSTGGAIKVGDRHVHFLKSVTSFNDGHKHKFRLSTFIQEQ